MKIRDRIKELRRVRASELREHPQNWRVHTPAQKSAMRGILGEVGIVAAAIAREDEDGNLEIIDGHLRADIAEDEEIPVLVLDVSEDEARKILLTFDPLSAMAEADAEALDEVLRQVNTSDESIAKLLDDLAVSNGIVPGEDAGIEQVKTTPPPPEMAWCLVGVPIAEYGRVQPLIEQLSEMDGIYFDQTVGNNVEED